MDPFQKRDALRAEAKALRDKLAAEKRGMTDTEARRVKAIGDELAEVEKKCDAIEASTQALAKFVGAAGTTTDDSLHGTPLRDGIGQKIAAAVATKALLPSGGVDVPIDAGIVPQDRATASLLGVITTQPLTGGNQVSYLRQTAREHAATTVPASGQKPTSTYTLEQAVAHVATVAHLSEPIPRQWLSDLPTLERFIAEEMGHGIEQAFVDFVLNGGTAEDGSEVVGLLDDEAVARVAFTGSAMLSVRRAIGQLDDAGTVPNAVVMSGSAWEAIETATYDDGKFILPGVPGEGARRSLWKVPVITSPAVPAGTAIVGDLRAAVGLLTREAVRTTWTEAGSELFGKNQVQFRTEGRAALAVPKPTSVRLVDLEDAA